MFCIAGLAMVTGNRKQGLQLANRLLQNASLRDCLTCQSTVYFMRSCLRIMLGDNYGARDDCIKAIDIAMEQDKPGQSVRFVCLFFLVQLSSELVENGIE